MHSIKDNEVILTVIDVLFAYFISLSNGTAVGPVDLDDSESYTGGSVATGTAARTGQDEVKEENK
jgi:hypothetical protein